MKRRDKTRKQKGGVHPPFSDMQRAMMFNQNMNGMHFGAPQNPLMGMQFGAPQNPMMGIAAPPNPQQQLMNVLLSKNNKTKRKFLELLRNYKKLYRPDLLDVGHDFHQMFNGLSLQARQAARAMPPALPVAPARPYAPPPAAAPAAAPSARPPPAPAARPPPAPAARPPPAPAASPPPAPAASRRDAPVVLVPTAPTAAPTVQPRTTYTLWTGTAQWPISTGVSGRTIKGAPWPTTVDYLHVPIVEYINTLVKVPSTGILGFFGSKSTKHLLQSRIDDGEDDDNIITISGGYPRREGPDFRQSYTSLLDNLEGQGVGERDVISGIINSFQLDLGGADKIQNFANIFHKNLAGGNTSIRNVTEWLRLKILLQRRAPVGPNRAAAASPVPITTGIWPLRKTTAPTESPFY